MDAIISDIHGNLEALDAVLDAIHKLHPKRIICLGDVVCYGPDTLDCIRRSVAWDVVVAGDWDQAMVDHDPTQWNPIINQHIEWVRGQLRSAPDSAALLDILRSFKPSLVENGRCFTHGTPDDVREWVFPEDTHDVKKLNRIAQLFDKACICGHSHIPGVFKLDHELQWHFIEPSSDEPYDLDGAKTIVTAGSVGQPRDGDPRASFLTIDKNEVRFHRVGYDIMRTVNKIRANSDIDNMYGERLLAGR